MENQLIEEFKKNLGTNTLNPKKINTNNNNNINISENPLKYIYDEEFISSINSLSNSIKNYFQNNKLYLGNIKLISENINEQTLFSKSVINDILLYFNQITKARYNNMNMNSIPLTSINEKYIKEKMKLVNERIEKINDFKMIMVQNIKNCEMAFLSFYEEAKNLFKKMKTIRTEKIENLNKKITVNKNININNINNLATSNSNNSNNNNNNLSSHKHNRTVSHSPSHKTYHINNNKNNSKNKMIQKKTDNRNNIKLNSKIIANLKNNNKVNYVINSNEDLNEIKNMKIRYIELLQENKKLKEDISKISRNTNNRQNKKVNTISGGTPSKELASVIKRCASATKKKYIQKPLSIGSLNNKNKKLNKSNSHSRIQTQAQTQSHITNTLSSLADEENNNKLIKSTGKKSELIPIGSGGGVQDRENNILSISKNSVDISTGIGGSCRNNNMNIINNNTSNITLASMVLSFLKEMRSLQENITKKVDNVKELKKNFELKKRELKKYSENIVESNFSSTYAGTNMNNLNNFIPDYSKVKSKEQSVKASIESFNTKDNVNYNDIIKEYEIKNKEQSNVIQKKEKEIEKLNKEIIDKSTKIESIEKELKSKEDKIKTEKEISNLKDEKLNSEKQKNKQKNDEISELKNKTEKIGVELQEAKNKISNLEKINNQLNESQNQQKKIIDDLKGNSKLDLNKFNLLNKEYKILEDENTSLKNDNMKLNEQVKQYINNLALLSNENESIIREKERLITNLRKNNEDLNNQIDLLNKEISKHGDNLSKSTILTEEISSLRKTNENNQKKILELQSENRQVKNRMAEIKTNYVSHDEDFKTIKRILTELNNKTESNLKKIKENERKLDIYSGTNIQIESNGIEVKKDDNKNIENGDKSNENIIKDLEKNLGEYKSLLEGLKNNNNSLININKIIEENA